METVAMPSGETEVSAAPSESSDPLEAHVNGDVNGSSTGEEGEADSSMDVSSESPPSKRVRLSKDSKVAVSDSISGSNNSKSPVVVELNSDLDSPLKTITDKINSVKRKLANKAASNDVSDCESTEDKDGATRKEKHRNGDVDASSSEVNDVSDVSESDTSKKTNNKETKNNASENGDEVMEVDNDIEEIESGDDIEEIQQVSKDEDESDIEEIVDEKNSKKTQNDLDDPLGSESDKKNGEEDDDKESETPSCEKTPDKQKIKDERRKSAEAKRQALLNITPRRSSRNLNKTKKYIDGEPEPEDPDIEEIMPVDPLAVSASERVKVSEKDPLAPTPEKEVPKARRKNTIIVNDTKDLAQIAANSKDGKKEPTLVIIDTNSILSGRGPIPVHNSSSSSSLPAALPAQGMYPVMHHPVPVTPSPPKPQPPPPAPKPKGPVGLTDDMYVVEAPSFIVPYVYEKPPKEPLKEVVEKMSKILREQDKKEREERQKEKKRKEKEREEREKKLKEDKEKQKEEKAKLEKEKAAEGDKAKKETGDKEDEPMEVDKDSPAKAKDPEKNGDDALSDKEEDEEVKADHDSDYKADSLKDKDSDEDEDIEYDSESDSSTSGTSPAKPKTNNYFESPLGKFFMQIGVNLVQEHVQTDLLRMQKRKLSKGGQNNPETQIAIQSLVKNLEQSKENNEPYKFQLHKCKFCNFKTESNIVLANHLEVPHLRNFMYHCNFCPVALRTNQDILFHMEAEHNISGRIERVPAFHQCPNCPFEDNQKSKMTRHAISCQKRFRPERNCEPPIDWEPPAKIPRMAKSRPPAMPNSQTAAQYMAQRAAGMSHHPLLPKMPSASMMPSLVAGAVRGRGRPTINNRYLPDLKAMPKAVAPSQLRQAGMLYQSPSSRQQQVLVPTSYQIAGNQIYQRWSQQVVGNQSQMMASGMPRLTLMPHSSSSSSVALVPNISGGSNSITIQSSSSKSPAAKLLQQPSISITPLPRQPSSASSSSPANFAHSSSKQQTQMGSGGGGKNSFVICEICDGYIKDLEQLRNHMQWIHKVKIHPKMIYNRPPLNCQKCQFRFFTDQGLERHLLGSHGLVTSSMQEASNKGKDGGRCPVCGRVYQWKLLNHVAKDHNMTLKPAHLSYKCTVCTATFGMYKQFENHVYSAHSVVAKRVMDKKAASNATSSSSRSYNHATESLLKPLKINDEITIIPQPAKMSSSSSRGRKQVCQADDSGSDNSL